MAEKPKCRSSVVTHSIKTLKQIVNHYADMAQRLKRLPAMQETWVRSLGREDALEKEMATHSSTIAWKIPWTEEPGRLQSMGLQRVGHDRATSLSKKWLGQELRKSETSPVRLPLQKYLPQQMFW